ncbi:hypothetical protein ABPG74_018508 [Tetrahymena malaccensis]
MNQVLTELKIDGTLQILDHANIHIKFEKLVFGKNGILKIGNTTPILNHRVTLEEIGDQSCSNSQIAQGIFIIESAYYEYNNLNAPVYKGSSTIRQSQFNTHLYVNQELFIVNTSSMSSENHTVKSINQKDIEVHEKIQNDFIDDPSVYENYIKHKRFIVYHKRNQGVFFKNMCIIGKESIFKGVAFVDVKEIQIQDSIFTHNTIYDQDKLTKQNQYKRNIVLHNLSLKNIFTQTKGLVIQINESKVSFESNLFFSNTLLELKLDSILEQNLFLNSNVELNFQNPKDVQIKDAQFYDSLITFNDENQIITIQIENSIFSQVKEIKIPAKVKQFKVKNSQLEQVVIDSSQDLDLSFLQLSENIFFCNGVIKSPIMVPSLQSRVLNQKFGTSSYLYNNTFIGYTHSIFNQPDYLDKYVERQNPQSTKTTAFTIILDKNDFIADKSIFLENENIQLNQTKPIFNVENIRLYSGIIDSVQYIQVEKYNQRNEFLQMQNLNYINTGYQFDYEPYQLKITNIIFAKEQQPNYQIYISSNGDYLFEANDSSIQIINQKYNTIYFRSDSDKNIIYDVQKLQLEISLTTKNKKSNRYKFFIQNFSHAIKKITASILNIQNDKNIDFVEGSRYFSKRGIILSRFPNQNMISIEWKKIQSKIQTIQLEISFELCDPGLLLNLSSNQCVQSCSDNQNKLGFFCKNKNRDTNSFYSEKLNGGQAQYIQCGYGCKVCQNWSQCEECYEPFKMNSGKCIDTCNEREFYNNNECQQCFEGCQNCESSDTCNILESHNIDDQGNKCIDGEINFLGICQKCSPECKTCAGHSLLDCTSCSENFSLYKNLCLNISEAVTPKHEQCKPGYGYQKSLQECIECQDNCLECKPQTRIRGSKGMICTTCNQQSYANGENDFIKCNKCPLGHFNMLNKCEKCNEACDSEEGCFGPSSFQCNKCKASYYMQISINQCFPCSENCQECQQSKENCTACPEINPILQNNKCLEECPSGFFSTIVNNILTCLECDKSVCMECRRVNTFCTKCADSSKFLFEGQCFSECQEGYFEDLQGDCSPCDKYRCKNCVQAPYKCTSCNKNEFLIDHNCYERCPEEGYYIKKNVDDLQCLKCPDTCRICQQINENDTSVICTQCKFALVLVNGQCQAKCPKGFYEASLNKQLKCLNCINKCIQCIEKEDFCTQCSDGYFLLNNKCLSKCPAGFFQDVTKNECINCVDTNCELCNHNIFYCSLCKNGFFLQQGQCMQACSAGFYLLNQNGVLTCLRCDKGCLECKDGPSNCTKCEKESYMFEQNQCLPSCPLNTYPDMLRICQPCSYQCTKGCVGPALEDCLESKALSFFI